jgi:hypothetical protein
MSAKPGVCVALLPPNTKPGPQSAADVCDVLPSTTLDEWQEKKASITFPCQPGVNNMPPRPCGDNLAGWFSAVRSAAGR